MDNPHEGHRQRLRRRFTEFGGDALADHELLELLLFYTDPRGDTNPLAHELVSSFGSLKGVLCAGVEELSALKGMSERKAVLIKAAAELGRRMSQGDAKRPVLSTVGRSAKYAITLMRLAPVERFIMLCLDSSLRLIGEKLLSEGGLESVSVDKRALASAALGMKAVSVILVHNHPGGSCRPSRADISLTMEIVSLLNSLGVSVLDHIITSGDEFYSFSKQSSFSAASSLEPLLLEQYKAPAGD